VRDVSEGVSSKRVINSTRGEVLARKAVVAGSARQRRRGLIGRESLNPGEALIIPGCRQVHSFGMRFPIDLVFIDGEGKVSRTCPGLRPRRISAIAWGSLSTVELPAGTIFETGTVKGDIISFLDRD
jgi:uncharacterized membrane protein (UPF0127 family)